MIYVKRIKIARKDLLAITQGTMEINATGYQITLSRRKTLLGFNEPIVNIDVEFDTEKEDIK